MSRFPIRSRNKSRWVRVLLKEELEVIWIFKLFRHFLSKFRGIKLLHELHQHNRHLQNIAKILQQKYHQHQEVWISQQERTQRVFHQECVMRPLWILLNLPLQHLWRIPAQICWCKSYHLWSCCELNRRQVDLWFFNGIQVRLLKLRTWRNTPFLLSWKSFRILDKLASKLGSHLERQLPFRHQ